MTHILYPKILRGKEAQDYKLSRKRVVKDYSKGQKIDGISLLFKYGFYTTAITN